MLFSKSIPEEVLANPMTGQFLDVLDSLQLYKQGIIADSMRANNPLLCLDETWLLRYLADFGFRKVPEGIPVKILQQMALNADLIFRLRGSLLGVQVLCNICTLGVATIDSSDFIKDFKWLLPNSIIDGYLTDTNDEDSFRYLIDDNTLNKARSLTVTIHGGIRNAAIEQYLKVAIEDYIGFHPNCTINLVFTNGFTEDSEMYHELLNSKMINEGSKTYRLRLGNVFNTEDIKTI